MASIRGYKQHVVIAGGGFGSGRRRPAARSLRGHFQRTVASIAYVSLHVCRHTVIGVTERTGDRADRDENAIFEMDGAIAELTVERLRGLRFHPVDLFTIGALKSNSSQFPRLYTAVDRRSGEPQACKDTEDTDTEQRETPPPAAYRSRGVLALMILLFD